MEHRLEDFPSVTAADRVEELAVEINTSDPPRITSVDELDPWLHKLGESQAGRVKVAIVQGKDPDNSKERDNSRSAWLMDVCCQLVRAELPDDQLFGVITDPSFRISASVLEHKGRSPEEYAIRQIRRAKAVVAGDDEPKGEFSVDKNGKPYPTQDNLRLAVSKLGHEIAYDKFARRETINGKFLDDAAADALYLEIEKRFGFRTAVDYFHKVLTTISRQNGFHPVVDYLAQLEWDGVERLGGWLTEYLGVEDSEYSRAVGEIVLTAAVRRVRQPGVKFDEMLVLESEQGTAKSSVLESLAVRDEWFSDDLPLSADTKRLMEAVAGKWIVEAADLKGMRRADADSLKSFLSRRIDRSRMAYGRRVEERPRQCVVIGTTNDHRYLKDQTGNRRFWPVQTGRIDLDSLRRDRDQLWAEAAHREAQGASIRLPRELWEAAGIEQKGRKTLNPMTEALESVLGDCPGILSSEDAWKIVGKADPGRRTQQDMEVLGDALRELGFERGRRRKDGQMTYCYVRGETDENGRKRWLPWLRLDMERESGDLMLKGTGEGTPF